MKPKLAASATVDLSTGLSFIADIQKIMFFGEYFNPKNIIDQR